MTTNRVPKEFKCFAVERFTVKQKSIPDDKPITIISITTTFEADNEGLEFIRLQPNPKAFDKSLRSYGEYGIELDIFTREEPEKPIISGRAAKAAVAAGYGEGSHKVTLEIVAGEEATPEQMLQLFGIVGHNFASITICRLDLDMVEQVTSAGACLDEAARRMDGMKIGEATVTVVREERGRSDG